jgi:hypothetical protein
MLSSRPSIERYQCTASHSRHENTVPADADIAVSEG